jgi:predicted RNA binding protein YcfA (HicA-like mRNA interferase family)
MKLPRNVSGAAASRALQRLGFTITRQVGSHARLARGDRRVTVPMHSALAPGTLQSILRQADVGLEEFLKVL